MLSDWATLCGSSLGILGLAIVLSTVGHAHWLAREDALHFRTVLATSPVQMACGLGLLLVSMGLFFSSRSTGERICWALFVVLYAVLGVKKWLLQSGRIPLGRNANSKTEG